MEKNPTHTVSDNKRQTSGNRLKERSKNRDARRDRIEGKKEITEDIIMGEKKERGTHGQAARSARRDGEMETSERKLAGDLPGRIGDGSHLPCRIQ